MTKEVSTPKSVVPTGSFFDRYATVDETQMQDGAPIDFGGGFKVTIRHVSSDAVSAARTRKTKEMRLYNRNKELTPEQQIEITRYVAAHAGIVTWSGGNAPAYNPELAIEIFKQKPEFLEDVLTAMNTYETYRKEDLEDASGN